ncbi:MAG: protein kinase family protein [Myxococcales bacterium]|nr:protein kinase family protein [Myxococcales bacterium]
MITPVTRRDLRSAVGKTWSGRLNDDEFLSRLYDLTALPSTDPRRDDMLGDVQLHTNVFSEDWSDDWIFDDTRLALSDDERLLRLLAESLHPEVLGDGHDVNALSAKLNRILVPDGFELFAASAMSGRPVFSWRRTVPRKPPAGDFPSSLVAGMSQILREITTSTGIDSMFEAEDFPRPDNVALNKEEKVKAWLRAAQDARDFDHWDGLARLLRPILEDTDPYREEAKTKIAAVLAKRGVRYLDGGMLTTAPQNELAELPARPPANREKWVEIGSGGFGVVYRATDPRLEIEFAWKVFEPYPGLSYADARARFLREAGLLFRLRHENIVRVYDAGELHDGRPYIKMEFFDGLNLNKARAQRPLSTDEVLTVVGRLAAAVEHAHSRSITHRDIKPSNVLISVTNEVRLIDFGLGVLVEEAVNRARLTKTTDHFGDAFSAPELLENAKTTDPAVDIYSIGAVWFWLHAGHTPKGVGADEAINGFGLAPALQRLLHDCLRQSPKDRPTAKAVLDGLREYFRTRSR